MSFICEDVWKLLRWRIKKYWSLFIKSWYPQLILFYTWANLFYKNYIIAPKVEPIESSCALFAKKICVNFNMHSNSIEITLWHECSPVNLLHILRTLFTNNTSGRLLLFLLYSAFWKKGIAKSNNEERDYFSQFQRKFNSRLIQKLKDSRKRNVNIKNKTKHII